MESIMEITQSVYKTVLSRLEMVKMKIIITDEGIRPIKDDNFSGDLLNNECFKIYIVKYKNKFLYVGKTKQTIGNKLRQGHRAYLKVKNGEKKIGSYAGYQWIEDFINKNIYLDYFVFNLGKMTDDFKSNDNLTEAVEAEIAYKIRKKTKSWPISQNEIHFYNFKGAKSVAIKILESIEKGII